MAAQTSALGIVGPQSLATGAQTSPFRQDRTASAVVAPGRAPFAEQTRMGIMFSACIPPGTGQAPGTAIGTTACFTLANPSSSGYNLVVNTIFAGYVSGTLGAGVLAVLAHFGASGANITAPTGGTAITPTNTLLGSTTASIANARFNNTVPASGIQIRALGSLQASLASTAVAPWQLIDYVNGAIIVGPGQAISIQGIAAAGTSPLIVAGATWAEELL